MIQDGVMSDKTYTEAEITQMVNAKAILEGLVESYFSARYDADPEWQSHFNYIPTIESIKFDGDVVEVECKARAWGLGCYGYAYLADRHYYKFPISYLWLDQTEVLADITTKVEAKAKADAKARALVDAKLKRKIETAERQKLSELKAKYEVETISFIEKATKITLKNQERS